MKRLSFALPFLLLIGLGIFIVYFIWNTNFQFFFSVNKVEFHQKRSISIGGHDDIVFRQLPDDLLRIEKDPQQPLFHWNLSKPYYVKLNNKTLNRAFIEPNRILRINGTGIQVESNVLIRQCRKFSNNYISVKNLLLSIPGIIRSGSDALALENVKSLITYKGAEKRYSIIFLDSLTWIGDKGFAKNGDVEAVDSFCCKVQFFKPIESDYLKTSDSIKFLSKVKAGLLGFVKPDFSIMNHFYYVKPRPVLTDWGAGHVYLSAPNDTTLRVTFPTNITIVVPKDTIDNLNERNKKLGVAIRQLTTSYPSEFDIHLPAISHNFSERLFEIRLPGDSVLVNSTNASSAGRLFPGFVSVTSTNMPGTASSVDLYGNARIIDKWFVSLPFLSLLIITLVALVLIYTFTYRRNHKCHDKTYANLDNTDHSCRSYSSSYFSAIFIGLIALLSIKLIITYQLSYTSPYFLNLFPVNIIVAHLVPIVIFIAWLLLDRDNHEWKEPGRHKRDIWISIIIFSTISLIITWFWYTKLFMTFWKPFNDSVPRSDALQLFPGFFKIVKYLYPPTTPDSWKDSHFIVVYTTVVFGFVILLFIWLGIKRFEQLLNKGRIWWIFIVCLTIGTLASLNVLGNFRSMLLTPLLIIFSAKVILSNYEKIKPGNGVSSSLRILMMIVWLIIIIVTAGTCLYFKVTPFWSVIVIAVPILCLLMFFLKARTYYSEVGKKRYTLQWIVVFPLVILLILGLYVVSSAGDVGFLIVTMGVLISIILFQFTVNDPEEYIVATELTEIRFKNILKSFFTTAIIIVILLFCVQKIFPRMKENITMERYSRRINFFSDFNNIHKQGLKYTENDAEFFAIISHYSGMIKEKKEHFPSSTSPIHSSISSTQSPVVINDLSFPVGFIASYHFIGIAFILAVWLVLLFMVYAHTLGQATNGPFANPNSKSGFQAGDTANYLHMKWLIRLFSVNILIFTSLYLLVSYFGMVPFTGRLIYGVGQDSVTEVAETLVFFILIGWRGYKTYEDEETQKIDLNQVSK